MKNYSRLLLKYANVSEMLPPAPEQGVSLPSFPANRAPDVDAIEQAQLKNVEEIEKAKEEGPEAAALRQQHIDEMLRALEEGEFFSMKEAQGILPPPPSERVEEEIPGDKISPFLSEFVIEEGKDSLDPEFWDKYEPEMTKERSKTRLPQAVVQQLEEMRQEPSDESKGGDRPTVPVKKKADVLLAKCDQYCKLATGK